jgi:hypothetical protein
MSLDYTEGGFVEGLGTPTAFGVTAQYFKIGQLYIDYTTNTGFVNYLGYENISKAFSGNTPLKTIEMRLVASDITGVYGEASSVPLLSVTGSSVISYFDDLISSTNKNTILKNKTKTVYPSTKYDIP